MNDSADGKEFKAAVDSIVAGLTRVPPEQKLQHLKRELASLPPDWRSPAEILVLQGEQLSSRKWEKIAVFVFGLFFLGALLVIALFVKEPTRFQHQVFCTVLALAAAGIGATLPGFIYIESKRSECTIRAGGAIALFLLVYWLACPH